MYTDGYIHLVDKHLRETPISTTPFPNYINTCSTDTPSNTAIRKTENTVVVPGFVAYPYLDDPFDDIDNQDKYLLHNYNNSPDDGFSFIFNRVNGYYSQFCKHVPFINSSVDTNAQLFRSYNQQLFVSIFNIINSYNNLKHNIWKNINYLQYFYHLFPIHVNKFYSLFLRFVNPKIEELKTSIKLLEGQNKIITTEITSLEKTKGLIEKLSGQITENAKELNNTITSHDKFICLAKTVGNQICSRFKQVKEKVSKEVTSFDEKLDQIARDSTVRIVGEVLNLSDKIEKYSRYAEKKLKMYIRKTEELKDYLVSKASLINSISTYLSNIDSTLVGLQRLKYPSKKIDETYIIRYNVPFEGGYIPRLKEFIKRLDAFLYDKRHRIWLLRERINNLIDFLVDVLLRDPTHEIIKKNNSFDFNKGVDRRPYSKELQQIRDTTSKLALLQEKIDKLRRKIRVMGPIEALFKEIRGLKSHMDPIREYITPSLVYFVDDLEYSGITKEEAVEFVKGMNNKIEKTIRKLHNAQKIIKFLQAIEVSLTTLRWVPEQKLEGLEQHLSELKLWNGLLKGAFSIVSKSFRQNIKQIVQIDRHDEIRSGPSQIKDYIDRVVPGLIKHVEQKITLLKIISEIKKQLDSIKSVGTNLNGVKGQNETSDIEKALEYLKEVDGKLYALSKSIESNVALIQESSGRIKDQNDDRIGGSGAEIQKYVPSIGQIPDKIAELHSKVRYDIVLLNIAKSVNETMNKVKDDAKKLKGTTGTIEDIKHQVESLGKRYGHIHSDIVALSDDVGKFDDLTKFKKTVESLKHVMGILNKNIKRAKMNKSYLIYSISEIKRYNKILLGISWEVAKGFSKIGGYHYKMPLVLLAHPLFGSILHGFHGLWLPLISSPLLILSVRVGFIMANLSLIRIKLERIVGSGLIKSIEEKVNNVDSGITDVESSIESVIICFLKCSNKSITNNTKETIKRILTSGGQVYNNELAILNTLTRNITGSENDKYVNVWALLSNMGIVESKFVVTKLYDCDMKTKEIKEALKTIYCECAFQIGCRNTPKCIKELPSYGDISDNFNETKERNIIKEDQNYICICLVIRYVMYPALMQCASYISNMDFDLLSIMERKFDKFNKSTLHSHRSKLAWFFVEITDRLFVIIKEKYVFEYYVCVDKVLHCFCRAIKDSYYAYFISTIICISFLVENMFRVDEPTIQYLVQQISSIYNHIYHDVSYYKVEKAIRLRNASISCLCSSEHICVCAQGKANPLCEICKNCKIICLSIYLICCMVKPFDSKFKCDDCKPCENHGEKCCICSDSCQASSCLKEISRVLKDCTSICGESSNSGGCKEICQCIKKLSEQNCLKLKFKSCFDGFVKKVCCNELNTGDSDSKRVDYSISRLYISCLYWISKMLSNMSYYGGVIEYIQGWRLNMERTKEHVSYAIKDLLEPSRNNVILTKANKMYDSTNEISNKVFEGASNNNYTYNDAYRINTSRAHGSLKYIIIKIVLILIIVVMTIFIRVKIETDDDYKMDGQFGEENGIYNIINSESISYIYWHNSLNMKICDVYNTNNEKKTRSLGNF